MQKNYKISAWIYVFRSLEKGPEILLYRLVIDEERIRTLLGRKQPEDSGIAETMKELALFI